MTRRDPGLIAHASAVALDGAGALIRGAAGSGKSALSLYLMALGAALLADDRTCLAATPRGLLAWAPDAILGLVEARGIGLLHADFAPPTPIRLVVDLDLASGARLPEPRSCDILGMRLPLIAGRGHPHLAAVTFQLLKKGLATDR